MKRGEGTVELFGGGGAPSGAARLVLPVRYVV